MDSTKLAGGGVTPKVDAKRRQKSVKRKKPRKKQTDWLLYGTSAHKGY